MSENKHILHVTSQGKDRLTIHIPKNSSLKHGDLVVVSYFDFSKIFVENGV